MGRKGKGETESVAEEYENEGALTTEGKEESIIGESTTRRRINKKKGNQ